MSPVLRGFAAAATVAFLVSAAVQWNDPDPIGWTLTYGVAAGLAGLAAAGHAPLLPNAAAFLLFAALTAVHAPHLADLGWDAVSSFRMHDLRHEASREAVGLSLCALWTGSVTLYAWRTRD